MKHLIETNLPFCQESRLLVLSVQRRSGEECKGCIFGFHSRLARGTLIIEFEGNGALLRTFLFEADKASILD